MLSLFQSTTSRQTNLALTILRIVTGVIFIAHGAQKLFVFGLDGVAGGFAQMGVPMASIMGTFIGFLEFFGGIALVLGLLTRLVSLGLAFNMLGAIAFVHAKAGFFMPNGSEFVLILLGATTALTIAGAGAVSLDALISRRDESVDVLPGDATVAAPATARRAA